MPNSEPAPAVGQGALWSVADLIALCEERAEDERRMARREREAADWWDQVQAPPPIVRYPDTAQLRSDADVRERNAAMWDAMRAALRELAQDRERLDWLEAQKSVKLVTPGSLVSDDDGCIDVRDHAAVFAEGASGEGGTPREAIDAAITRGKDARV